ncbi:hypothetical protein JN531_016670 (plasmid) [Flagellatimonas centrodinii]|uniref:hypothetical protein n=1 Tax=Flagellatimonas centrodinii TaxID=2806210 RepID=UPI001FF9C80B|nr:hypothetical protein [Flagellatimonas centrodinii]ULQ48411.1 hypothetical protein JN531_016670 [Flagellatimonas centrodinii]
MHYLSKCQFSEYRSLRAQGLPATAIAAALNVSPDTIEDLIRRRPGRGRRQERWSHPGIPGATLAVPMVETPLAIGLLAEFHLASGESRKRMVWVPRRSLKNPNGAARTAIQKVQEIADSLCEAPIRVTGVLEGKALSLGPDRQVALPGA